METKVSEESRDKSLLWLKSFLFFCYRRETPSQMEIYALLLGKNGEGGQSFSCVYFLRCLQLKRIIMPTWSI